ncbi:hypothetical protein E2F46_12400 [Luteimonas aestuarii]|uniref:Uncharacterized protein n=1 Tax=Luteimonas aestuarii TaxID=453837 RepID=A0A4R5TKC5_9GAMM|nr:hypothetical protein [Luteimonas aestuarii]TDK22945.1 hypothetical protein E2F46_12400 [Luteimonas aestuarii]
MNEDHNDNSNWRRQAQDRLHDLQLLRDMRAINERTQRELGPLPLDGLPGEPRRKPNIQQDRPPHEPESVEDEKMKISHAAAAAAVISVAGTLSGCDLASDRTHDARGAEVIADQSASAATAKEADLPSFDEIVRQVMERQYGSSFKPELQCWKHTIAADSDITNYCMKPSEPHVVDVDGNRRLYFMAYSEANIPGNDEYWYSHSSAGLMGAFEVKIESDGQWSLESASNEMEFGSIGDCGCKNAQFVRLGENHYGWMFASGGTWQGSTSVVHNIVAPRNGRFEDVSRIPMVEEDDQTTRYDIQLDESNPETLMFPVIVVKSKNGHTERLLIQFDLAEGTYSLNDTKQ